jgi:hypothetical protein
MPSRYTGYTKEPPSSQSTEHLDRSTMRITFPTSRLKKRLIQDEQENFNDEIELPAKKYRASEPPKETNRGFRKDSPEGKFEYPIYK